MSDRPALVLVGHGSHRGPGAADALYAHADRLRASGPFEEVRPAFWQEEPSLRSVRRTLHRSSAVVVPVLTSEGYFAEEVFPRELGVDDLADARADVELAYADPVGTHPALADVVADRVEVARSGPAEELGVVLVGHGTDRNPNSAAATRSHAERLRARGDYAEVAARFLDEAPAVADLTDHVAAEEVVVVPVFVADGPHTAVDVPSAFGHPGIGETARLDGRTVHYTGAVGTAASLSDVIRERAEEAAARLRTEPGDGPAAGAPAAFASWVETADGGRALGELHVSSRAGGFELRHRIDAGRPRSAMDALDAPRDLRDRARTDDRGRYRPLSGARSLPTGWTLGGLDAAGLDRAVNAVYPGAVAAWHRDRRGDLDVTPLAATVDRQTGRYAELAALDPRALDAAVEAVCGDCVREPRWTDGAEGDAGGGSTAIPCAEACPFLLSAAHALRGVEPAGVDDEDPAAPVGAFEVAGNRYRTRFARGLADAASATPDGRAD